LSSPEGVEPFTGLLGSPYSPIRVTSWLYEHQTRTGWSRASRHAGGPRHDAQDCAINSFTRCSVTSVGPGRMHKIVQHIASPDALRPAEVASRSLKYCHRTHQIDEPLSLVHSRTGLHIRAALRLVLWTDNCSRPNTTNQDLFNTLSRFSTNTLVMESYRRIDASIKVDIRVDCGDQLQLGQSPGLGMF
jgi:hypothetical protein